MTMFQLSPLPECFRKHSTKKVWRWHYRQADHMSIPKTCLPQERPTHPHQADGASNSCISLDSWRNSRLLLQAEWHS